jgi:hypothetical protein
MKVDETLFFFVIDHEQNITIDFLQKRALLIVILLMNI